MFRFYVDLCALISESGKKERKTVKIDEIHTYWRRMPSCPSSEVGTPMTTTIFSPCLLMVSSKSLLCCKYSLVDRDFYRDGKMHLFYLFIHSAVITFSTMLHTFIQWLYHCVLEWRIREKKRSRPLPWALQDAHRVPYWERSTSPANPRAAPIAVPSPMLPCYSLLFNGYIIVFLNIEFG